ncbi:MAG: hypothetical protein IJF18_08420 [Oscillospiraceae bacterium]|nr:hypothetical protein [Oscillospiraceae bacterium]
MDKKVCKASLVLGIVGLVFSLFAPAVTYSCSVTGLAIGVKKKDTHKCSAAIALNIVALVIAAINSVCAVVMTLKMFGKDEDKETAVVVEEKTEE